MLMYLSATKQDSQQDNTGLQTKLHNILNLVFGNFEIMQFKGIFFYIVLFLIDNYFVFTIIMFKNNNNYISLKTRFNVGITWVI